MKPKPNIKKPPGPIRQGVMNLSLGADVIAQLDELWRDYILKDGGRAACRSEAVRDMIACAREKIKNRKR